jgi:hypothetical protein
MSRKEAKKPPRNYRSEIGKGYVAIYEPAYSWGKII